MDREILFRGKQAATGKWVEWSPEGLNKNKVDTDTIGQYTGLTDKNGDYCRDECGQHASCQRLDHARRHKDLSLRCKDALRYKRIREYENTGFSPEEVMGLDTREVCLKMARDMRKRAEKQDGGALL